MYTYTDGKKYEGGFKNAKYDGEGILTYPAKCKDCTEKVIRGVWVEGKFLRPQDNKPTEE